MSEFNPTKEQAVVAVVYCEDCRWLRPDDRCGHVSAVKFCGEHLVKRGMEPSPPYLASIQRGSSSGKDCGPGGMHFERKQP